MNHRIQIIETLRRDDLPGEVQEKDAVIAELWANVLPMTASKQVAFKQAGWEATHEITLRYSELVKSYHAVCWNGETFTITNIGYSKTNGKIDKKYMTLTVGRNYIDA